MIPWKGKHYKLVEGGDCSDCAISTLGRWLNVFPTSDSAFCMQHCKVDHKKNHWEKVSTIRVIWYIIRRRL